MSYMSNSRTHTHTHTHTHTYTHTHTHTHTHAHTHTHTHKHTRTHARSHTHTHILVCHKAIIIGVLIILTGKGQAKVFHNGLGLGSYWKQYVNRTD